MMRRAARSWSARRLAPALLLARHLCPTRSGRPMRRPRQEPRLPLRMRADPGSARSSTAKTPLPLRHSQNGSYPGAPGKPGARDANVLNYIDLGLSGAYADLQYFYRRGLASLDAYCRKTYKEPFRGLSAAQQDEVIAALEQGKASEFSWP